MSMLSRITHPDGRRRGLAVAGALALAALGATGLAEAQQNTSEITVTVKSLTALDKADVFTKDDFFARITIAGETFTTPTIRQKDFSDPRWRVSKRVPRGSHDVRIALFDKDLTKDDPIDINPRKDQPKRDLDFKVSTPDCGISGLIGARCDRDIKRAGDERKKAEIVFKVDVKR